jgi:hypothetical protein
VGRDDFPITIVVFLFSNYPARPFKLFLQKITTERQNCRVVVWVRTSVAWCVVLCRGVVSFHVSTYNTKVSISHHEKDLHIYSKVPTTYLH